VVHKRNYIIFISISLPRNTFTITWYTKGTFIHYFCIAEHYYIVLKRSICPIFLYLLFLYRRNLLQFTWHAKVVFIQYFGIAEHIYVEH